MDQQSEREYIENRWEHPALISMQKVGFVFPPGATKTSMINAAYLFTVACEQEITDLSKGIALVELEVAIFEGTEHGPTWECVLNHLTPILADKRKGMKQ